MLKTFQYSKLSKKLVVCKQSENTSQEGNHKYWHFPCKENPLLWYFLRRENHPLWHFSFREISQLHFPVREISQFGFYPLEKCPTWALPLRVKSSTGTPCHEDFI